MGNDDLSDRLAPPKLSLRRRKKERAPAEDEANEPADQSADQPDAEAAEEPPAERAAEATQPIAAATAPEPDPQPDPQPDPEPAGTAVLAVEETRLAPALDEPDLPAEPDTEPDTEGVPATVVDDTGTKTRSPRIRPPGMNTAAAVVGLAVGLFFSVAIWVCEQISQQARGTTSLGSAGFPILIAIFVLAVAIGALFLKLAGVTSPISVSFLGTCLVSVIGLLFLSDSMDTFTGALIVVAVAIVSFVLFRWVNDRYLEEHS
ncbi:MAG: hypothetical protein QM638_03945 [Nocardioides sp.]|uniref:hypothetical protein n=1 Tax=Nocardioides sp. TaxID=35761 RepID=UPI0039E33F69